MESRSRRTSESPFRGHHVAKDATVRIGSEAQRSALSYYSLGYKYLTGQISH